MRSNEELVRGIRRREAVYQSLKTLRRKIAAEAAACGVCAVLIAAVVCVLPEIRQATAQAPACQYGSLILAQPAAGYVVIMLLSYALGTAAVLLCRHWKQWKEKEREIE